MTGETRATRLASAADATLTDAQRAKLARIARRSTRYEVVLTGKDGTKLLLCYAPQSRQAVGRYLLEHRARIDALAKYSGDAFWAWDFSGRTQREAIIAGELPWYASFIERDSKK